MAAEGGSGQLRAVKVVSKQQINVREVEAMVELRDHPTLFVIFLGWFEDPHSVHLVMEYIEYGDLAQYIKTNGETAAIEATGITSQVLRALVVLHSRDICHRDLKPGNILIISRSPIWVKITDFGISKQSSGTSLRAVCGTPSYQAPEMLGLLPNNMRPGRSTSYTKVVDLWALGAIVHEMLTSEIPFLDTYEGSDMITTKGESMPFSAAAEPDNLPAAVDTNLLHKYCFGSPFPIHVLEKHGATQDAIELVKRLMAVNPKDRISATDALASPWLFRPQHQLKREFQLLGRYVTLDDANRLAEASRDRIIDILNFPEMGEIQAIMSTAVSMGYMEVVRVLLKVTDDISSCSGPENMSFLMLAARKSQVPAMKLLLRNGVNINESVKPYCRTALHEAAAGGHLDALRVLLDSGANANMMEDQEGGESALHAATAGGYVDAMKLLLERGADVNWAPRAHGHRAFHATPIAGHVDAMKLLLEREANANRAPRAPGGRDLHAPAAGGRVEAMKHVFEGGGTSHSRMGFDDGQEALYAAAAGGHLDTIKVLLNLGVDVTAAVRTKHGQSPLYAAAAGGHLDAIKLLLDAGADVNHSTPNRNGQTPLHGAAANGHVEAMLLMLVRGAKATPPALTHDGQLPLYAAAAGGHLDVIKLLLDLGVEVDAAVRNKYGQTPLYAAAAGGHVDAIELLLDAGADVNLWAPNPHGQTPLYGAAAKGHLEAMLLLLARGAKATQPAPTYDGETPLHAAAMGGHFDAIKLLLKHGAIIEERTIIAVRDPVILTFLNDYRLSVAGRVARYSVRVVSARERFPLSPRRVVC